MDVRRQEDSLGEPHEGVHSLEELFESEPELMGIILKAGGLTHHHLALLSSVSRKWRRLMTQETILRVLCPFAKESVLACGRGAAGLLTIGQSGEVRQPKPVELLVDYRISAAVIGEQHAVFLSTRGDAVHLSYFVSSRGVRPLTYPLPSKVTKVSSSRRHTLLLTETGQVFGVGYNSTGQCGGSTATYFHRPHQVEGLQQHRIADIAAGYHHSLVVTDQGQVFAFGKAAEGQLGIGRAAKGDQAAPTGRVAVTRNLVDRGRRAVAVSAGETHSLVLAHDGALLYFGTMTGGPPVAHHPTEVMVVEGERVVGLSSGRHHALVLTDRGRVYSFGCGDKGQLGHGDFRGRERPERITAFDDKRIEQIASGAEHSLVRTASGVVWVFGDMFGQDQEKALPKPTIMCLHSSAIAAGQYSSLVVV